MHSREGFALVLTTEQYKKLWNTVHPDDLIEDDSELWELNDATDVNGYDIDNCCRLNYETSETHQELKEQLGAFGTAIDDKDHCQTWSTSWLMFAPKDMSYFEAPYKNLDDMIEDFVRNSELLTKNDHDFIRGHLAYVKLIAM